MVDRLSHQLRDGRRRPLTLVGSGERQGVSREVWGLPWWAEHAQATGYPLPYIRESAAIRTRSARPAFTPNATRSKPTRLMTSS